MKRILVVLAAMFVSLSMFVGNAEAAKRLGGGKSVGSQRDGVTQRQATPPAAAPSAAAGAAAAGQRAGMSRWLAPLAGLAAGLGLAYLFGDQIGSLLVGLLIAVAVIFAIRMFLARRAGGMQPATAAAGAGGNNAQYSGMPRNEPSPVASGLGGGAAAAAVPAGFDVNGFIAQAKQAFMTLQGANDRGDLDAVRDMTTDEMFAAIKQEFEARKGESQNVEVVTLNADLIEVVTERGVHWASVRFTGSLREDGAGVPERFAEVWNLQKPVDGSAGWMLAGIQQVQ